jgi:acyl dehydratase
LQVNWNFRKPVRPGDTITGKVKVTRVREDKPITELETSVCLSDQSVVLDGIVVCYTMPIKGQ